MWDWMWGPGFGLGWFFPLIFWVLIIWLITYLIRSHRDGKGSDIGNGQDAMEILKKRYAKGEITKEQFDQMKKDLQ